MKNYGRENENEEIANKKEWEYEKMYRNVNTRGTEFKTKKDKYGIF